MAKSIGIGGREFYEQLNILDKKCEVLLQLAGVLLGLNIIPTALRQLPWWAKFSSGVTVLGFLATTIMALAVIWVEWEPNERTLAIRTHFYKCAVLSTGLGLVGMGFVSFTLLLHGSASAQ